MSTLNAAFAIHTRIVWSTSDEGIAQEIAREAQNGWSWDGSVHWKHENKHRTCVAILTSVSAFRVAPDNPRLVLFERG